MAGLDHLNDAQKQAVLHDKGPLLVLAGPGSGKTTVITLRVLNLITAYGVNPANILVITFTKAAAREMEQRFRTLALNEGIDPGGAYFSTFHAVFFYILRCAYGYTAANIIKPEQKRDFFKEILVNLDYEVEDEREFSEKLQSEISLVKGEGINLENYYSMNCPQDVFIRAYRMYEEKMTRFNLIDFDDMQLLCYDLLTKRPDILAMWQKRFKYVCVDEVQDTNMLQYKLTKLLASPQDNLMMVGDDDQSIYRFRGARPEIMLSFFKDYPQGKKIILNVNYRSRPQIVEMASRLIKNNTARYEKSYVASRKEDSTAVFFDVFEDAREQNGAVLDRIRALHDGGVPYSSCAVLYRTNILPRQLAELFLRVNLPFVMKDVIPNIYEHWIFRDIKTYMDLAGGRRDRSLFLQIINKPLRYISRDAFENEEVSFEELCAFYHDKPYVRERIEKLERDLLMIRDMKPYAAMHYIFHVVGYCEYIESYAQYRNMKQDELLDIYEEIKESAKSFDTLEQFYEHIKRVKNEMKERAAKNEKQKTEGVCMMTYHSSKGLEFPYVFLIDVNDKVTPYSKAVTPQELEEERRMFYVAFTRAKDCVHICWTKNRYGKPAQPSPYIGELMASRSDFFEGARVMHAVFGQGVITKVKDGRLHVKFDKQKKERVLDLDFCIQNQILCPFA